MFFLSINLFCSDKHIAVWLSIPLCESIFGKHPLPVPEHADGWFCGQTGQPGFFVQSDWNSLIGFWGAAGDVTDTGHPSPCIISSPSAFLNTEMTFPHTIFIIIILVILLKMTNWIYILLNWRQSGFYYFTHIVINEIQEASRIHNCCHLWRSFSH